MQVQFNVLFYLYWNVNFILAVRYNIWDLSSQTRDQTCVSCIGGIVPWPLDCQGSPKMWMICTDYTHLRDYFITFKYFIVLTFPKSQKLHANILLPGTWKAYTDKWLYKKRFILQIAHLSSYQPA